MVGFVASNVSLNVVGLAAHVSTSVAQAITADGITNEVAAQHLSERTVLFLGEDAAIVVLFLLVFVVLMILWVIVEIVRIVIVILLMVGGPAMLMFHGLPQTNRAAQMWWRALGAVCLVPVAQALAFVALMRVFFEGDARAMFGAAQVVRGDVNLFDLFLLLVLVYVQIRIPVWAYRAVWSGPSGRSPAAGVAKALTWAVVLAAASAATGGGAATAGAVGGRKGALLRVGHQGIRRIRENRTTAPTATTPLPRRARNWRFGTPGTRPTNTSQVRRHPARSGGSGTLSSTHPNVPGTRAPRYASSAPESRRSSTPPTGRPSGSQRHPRERKPNPTHTPPDRATRPSDPRPRMDPQPRPIPRQDRAPARPPAPRSPDPGVWAKRAVQPRPWHRKPRPPWRWNLRRD
ncbi:hypothetical protein [Nocardiopsis sp. FIRDI 009]|uniref:hypothetical protein n=1 Tax=Nocardiopsis sp. FIRDI 009 TaxID=714197 RepID=UPI000E23A406|nr:hypothetical protein [Nocardiopsis sp. FIRDI 009]